MPWYPDSESVSFWKHAYIPAEELVGSIKRAMEDKTMAANLERIHNIYMDREEKPVKKVTLMMNKEPWTDKLEKWMIVRQHDAYTTIKS